MKLILPRVGVLLHPYYPVYPRHIPYHNPNRTYNMFPFKIANSSEQDIKIPIRFFIKREFFRTTWFRYFC